MPRTTCLLALLALAGLALGPAPTADVVVTPSGAEATREWQPSFTNAGTLGGGLVPAGDDSAFLYGHVGFGEGGQQPAVLFGTDDQGTTWTPRTPPLTNFTRIDAFDADVLAAQGGRQVRVSTDGGLTWEAAQGLTGPGDHDSGDVTFDRDGELWVTFRALRGCNESHDFVLRRSDDLGRSGRTLDLPAGWSPTSAAPGPGRLALASAFRCDDDRSAWFLTRDDGATWEQLDAAATGGDQVHWVDEHTAVLRTSTDRLVGVTDIDGDDGPAVRVLRSGIDTLAGHHDRLAVTTTDGRVQTARVAREGLVDVTTVHEGVAVFGLGSVLFPDDTMLTNATYGLIERSDPDAALDDAAVQPVDPAWTPVVPTPGMWSAELTSVDATTGYALLENVSDASASATVLLRTDDAGRSFQQVHGPVLGQPAMTAVGDRVLLRTFNSARVSLDRGVMFTSPPHLQRSLVALDHDGGTWWSPRELDQCAGDVAYRTETSDGQRSAVRLPAGWEVTQSISPGPGTRAVVVAATCAQGRRAVLATGDDGATWTEVGPADGGYETVARGASSFAWAADGTAVVEADGRSLYVITGLSSVAGPRIDHVELPDAPGPDVLAAEDVESISVAGQRVVVATSSGEVVAGRLVYGEVADLRTVRDGLGSSLDPSAAVFVDGSVLAHVDQHSIERRAP